MGFRRENWPYGGQFSFDKGKGNLSETSCKNKRELVNCEIVVVGRHVRLGNTNCPSVFFFQINQSSIMEDELGGKWRWSLICSTDQWSGHPYISNAPKKRGG